MDCCRGGISLTLRGVRPAFAGVGVLPTKIRLNGLVNMEEIPCNVARARPTVGGCGGVSGGVFCSKISFGSRTLSVIIASWGANGEGDEWCD